MSDVVTSELAEIPRLFTALAEWGACVVFIAIVRRRMRWLPTVGVALAGLAALVGLQLWADTLPLALWIPGMLGAALTMFALLFASLRITAVTAGYLTARAFVLAEFVASLHWQLERFYLPDAEGVARAAFLALVYGGVLVLAWLAERRHLTRGAEIEVGWRELVSALAIAAATFGISNLSFANANTPFSSRLGPEIFYIRTLVDLCGYIALYVQHEVRREMQTRRDAEAMSQLLRSQHDQYELSRRAIDEVSRKYHDMKHHLDALRAETDPRLRERMLDDLEESIRDYGAQVRTGNRVVDVVLTGKRLRANEDGVDVSYVADGRLLDFMSPLDVTAVLGNALDNAIEATKRIADADERLVRVALFAQDDFVMLRVENTFDGIVKRSDGRIVSRKREAGHGYGLRNIEAAVERYGGSLSISADERWFSLRALFPR
ncbi:GHKL domain-containing protein [Microbacterium sp. JZ37]|uniref:GHKL domain-containing protein n=1 Tax=Microbacterium sp. JZ37 TaxID=2654193 RepID=UPI002B45A96F|nr:GHKL domain-containing protein [Microbacterium sp. JZ37]WRH16509.1 GHKL domain-containing protein [Microbacterium sp. JZ37]